MIFKKRIQQFVSDIVQDIQDNPETWRNHEGKGLKKDNVLIYDYGGGMITTIIKLQINSHNMKIKYNDAIALEKEVKNWYQKASLKQLKD